MIKVSHVLQQGNSFLEEEDDLQILLPVESLHVEPLERQLEVVLVE